MKKNISDYLGLHASIMLNDEPFKGWLFERSVEEELDPPIVHYIFPARGVELRCDDDEKVSVIFLQFDEMERFDTGLDGLPFSWTRKQVMDRFGTPSKSGEKSSHPILGLYGAWDRFAMPNYTIRFEYNMDSVGVRKITLMRNDIVP